MSVSFETHPDQYKHWQFEVDGQVARLSMNVQIDQGMQQDQYALKLNSYDLSVDIELADAISRLRFEHPNVRAVIVSSAIDRIFCAGANIYMLQSSPHSFKVNFCKFTNETRLYIEDACQNSDQHYIAALNGTASGGGYELAMACEEIHLVDDGNSAVSLPEVPLLGVLPGTGGLTRLVDKRKVRRDLADLFSTVAEGVKGQRTVDWHLVDAIHSRTKFQENVTARAAEICAAPAKIDKGEGIAWPKLDMAVSDSGIAYQDVKLELNLDERFATLTIHAPKSRPATDPATIYKQGADYWGLRAYRELDQALLHLRFNYPRIGLILLKTKGCSEHVLAVDQALAQNDDHWFVREVRLHMARVLRRLDQTSRSLFAIIEPGSCFAGNLLEVALSADRSYMLNDPEQDNFLQLGPLNFGFLATDLSRTRLAIRFHDDAEHVAKLADSKTPLNPQQALELGLVTMSPDDLDWQDDVRIAIEERLSYSPDALTGMEQNLRFVGSETMSTKIFGRLSAWQNWIFQRPNAVGPKGALTAYGKPERPSYHWTRI